jgi:hypothetical protein
MQSFNVARLLLAVVHVCLAQDTNRFGSRVHRCTNTLTSAQLRCSTTGDVDTMGWLRVLVQCQRAHCLRPHRICDSWAPLVRSTPSHKCCLFGEQKHFGFVKEARGCQTSYGL